MLITLSTNFDMDTDTSAVVRAKMFLSDTPIADIRIDYAFEGTSRHHVRVADLTRDMSLSARDQMKIAYHATELIDSFFTGADAPSRIEI